MVKSNGFRRKKRLIVMVVSLIIIAAILNGCNLFYGGIENKPITVEYTEGDLIIHFVDVGQGDSIIIQFPDNKTMIIDGGPRSAKKALIAYIDNLKITAFDYLLLTHSDEDHCGSLDDVILNYEIKTIFMPDTSFVSGELIGTVVYKDFLSAANDEKYTDKENNKKDVNIIYSNPDADFSGTGYKMDFITPNAADYNIFKAKKPNAEGLNSISPIMLLTFNGKKIMFTGDANETSEEVFLENIEEKEIDYNVDILKVGHHGSRTSTTLEFLEVVKPEIAIIEAGAGNKYGHPHSETLARLKTCNDSGKAAEIYRTDLNGDIIFKITSDGTETEILPPVLARPPSSSANRISNNFSEYLSFAFINMKDYINIKNN